MADSEKILVVDDEGVIRELLTEILEDEGYVTEAAPNASVALEMLAESSDFILLFTDIMMPGMDGIALVREARKVRPDLIPIVMTGFATLETARAAVKEGAYDYVLKPFSLSEIKLAVSNAFERYRLIKENTRLKEFSELFDISERVATIRDERELLNFVLHAALEHVGAERGSLMLTTPDGNALQVAASVGVPEDAAQSVVQMGSGISGWVAAHSRPLLIEDIQKNPDVAEVSRRLQDDSFISVPLERKTPIGRGPCRSDSRRVLAVLNVNCKKDSRRFTEGDLKILSIMANHAAVALDNVRLIKDVEEAHLSTLQSMALLLEAKDAYTHGHSERVRDYSLLAARHLGLTDHEQEVLRTGAALHDIGKVGVTDAVLNKAGRPSDDEWAQIRRHPMIGFDVLAPVNALTPEHLQLVRSHHERVDGNGYPDQLKGDQIPVTVRIIALADAYDAMSSNRAYRKAMPAEAIMDELHRGRGTQFDADILDIFIELLESGEINQTV